MSPTPRLAVLVGALGVSALVLPAPAVAVGALALLAAALADLRVVRRRAAVERDVRPVLARGVASPLALTVGPLGPRSARLRQATPAALDVQPAESQGRLDAQLTPLQRGRHCLPAAAARLEGPLGLTARLCTDGEESELVVMPDLPAARRLALAVRSGRFSSQGHSMRGPLGLGTEFEAVRDYLPDDDVRQVNWRATARLGRPMSNQYRVEQDRDLVCMVDSGRLMAASLGDRSRLDAALDAVAAVALVADESGDRCGALAFDAEIRRKVRPQRKGADPVVRALFDLEPSSTDTDFELGFRSVAGGKRALVIVFCDVLDEAAARSLLDAVPVLARRHHTIVASALDPDLAALAATPPADARGAYTQAVAVDMLETRRRVTRRLGRAGAEVIEATPSGLGAACVRAYLSAKARARL